MNVVEWACVILGTCVGLLLTVGIHSHVDGQAREIKMLKESKRVLLAQLESEKASSSAASKQLEAAERVHTRWEWTLLVKELLLPFETITTHMLDSAVKTCFDNGTMYCMRAQVIGGNLYITDYRAIFFDRYYAPSRVMPLLETLRRHPHLPDLDLVVVLGDLELTGLLQLGRSIPIACVCSPRRGFDS